MASVTPTPGAWWLKTAWQRHRWTAAEVHPLLVALEQPRGPSFMTPEHVAAVLDAHDPQALAQSWIGAVAPAPAIARRTRGLGLPTRLCAWREGGDICGRSVRSVNAKFCEAHAAASRRKSTREAVRRLRGKQSSPPLAPVK